MIILISLALLIWLGFYIVNLIKHTQPIPPGAVTLDLPLKNGHFYISVGGRTGTFHTSVDQKYALDIIRVPKFSEWFQFRNTSLEANSTYNTPIYSPCTGTVKKVIDGLPDQPIGINQTKTSAGNSLILHCDGGFYVFMTHFKAGTIQVKVDDSVQTGQRLAQIGNSGLSGGPHLHIDAYKFGSSTNDVIPLPIIFNGKYFLTGDSFKN